MIPVTAAFLVVFSHFAITSADLAARVVTRSLLMSLLLAITLYVMVARRTPYFGTADVMTALPLSMTILRSDGQVVCGLLGVVCVRR